MKEPVYNLFPLWLIRKDLAKRKWLEGNDKYRMINRDEYKEAMTALFKRKSSLTVHFRNFINDLATVRQTLKAKPRLPKKIFYVPLNDTDPDTGEVTKTKKKFISNYGCG